MVTTQLGTRVVLLLNGGSIVISKGETEVIELSVYKKGGLKLAEALLTTDEALTLVEFLAVAARRGTGREVIEAASAELPEGRSDV